MIEASTIQDPISFATTLRDEDGPMWGPRLVEAVRGFRHWVGVLAMVNDENNCAVVVDEDGGERFDVAFQPSELERIDASFDFSRKVLEAAGATQVCWTGLASTHVQGSCRMGDDPERSAVDRNGEVHGVERLFVGDGSLIPRTLSVNPSLTIMALATRLADHLARRPGRVSPVKAALLSEYHRPLELVDRPEPEPVAARDVVVRIGGAGVCATDLHAIDGLMEPAGLRPPRRPRPRERRLGARGRRRRHGGLGRRRRPRLPGVQLRPLRRLPPRAGHALRAPPVHRSDARRRLRRLRARRRALARAAAAGRRAGRRRAACRRGHHRLPRRQEAAPAARSGHERRS